MCWNNLHYNHLIIKVSLFTIVVFPINSVFSCHFEIFFWKWLYHLFFFKLFYQFTLTAIMLLVIFLYRIFPYQFAFVSFYLNLYIFIYEMYLIYFSLNLIKFYSCGVVFLSLLLLVYIENNMTRENTVL